SAEHEQQNESANEKKWHSKPRASGPKRDDPTKDLYPARDRDHHARRAEEASPEQWNRRCKHVVHPQPETDECRRDERKHHHRITENAPAGKRLYNHRNHSGRRNENDVNLGMAEEPKQMLVQQRVAAFGRIKKMRVYVC